MIEILENLRTVDPEEVKKIDDSDKIVGMILDTREIDLNEYPDLKVISRVGVGVDNIDFDECDRRGISVCISPCKELTQSVAEHAVGQILTFVKKKKRMLESMKIGIIGFGRIGKRIAKLLHDMSYYVVMYDIEVKSKRYYYPKSNLLSRSDVVIISVSGNDQIIGKEEINLMKDNAILVNIARKECVCEESMEQAIEEGRLGGFISDVNSDHLVYKIEPYYRKNIVITPHVASDTYEARKAMEERAIENLKVALGKGE